MTNVSGNPRKALGKGLSSLLGPKPSGASLQPATLDATSRISGEQVVRIPLEDIDPNPLQCRTVFDNQRLQELADSIRSNGVIQPLVVRRNGVRFQLVAGERRWRASRMAGLKEVPALVQELPDDRLLEVTLIENIQREDLTAIEIARAFERLVREVGLSHEEIARRTGKDRSTVSNMLRLLRLPPDVQQLVSEHRLSMGHARAILSLPTEELQRQVAEKAASQGLSVRQVERLVHRMTESREPKSPEDAPLDPNLKAAVQALEEAMGTRVRIVARAQGRGRIEIEFYSEEDLQRLYEMLTGARN
ncbi:MAG: ParB/RepB/Spo0J family partition protein [Bryobacteraceae bacterium]